MSDSGATPRDGTVWSAVARAWPHGWHVQVVEVTGSTNTDLLAAAAAGAPDRAVLAARHQTAGRGRLDRRWEAPPGSNLLVSMLFRHLPQHVHELTQRVALAALDAVAEVGGVRAGLKWPNDLLVDGAKLAGVLAQAAVVDGRIDHVVVGIGINVGWAPDGGAMVGQGVDPLDVLVCCGRTARSPADVYDRATGNDWSPSVASGCGWNVRPTSWRARDRRRPRRPAAVLGACGITHHLDTGDVVPADRLTGADTRRGTLTTLGPMQPPRCPVPSPQRTARRFGGHGGCSRSPSPPPAPPAPLVSARAAIDRVPRVEGVAEFLSPSDGTVENFLLVSGDSRAGSDPNSPDFGGIGSENDVSGPAQRHDDGAPSRQGDGDASLLSIPRDLWVDIPDAATSGSTPPTTTARRCWCRPCSRRSASRCTTTSRSTSSGSRTSSARSAGWRCASGGRCATRTPGSDPRGRLLPVRRCAGAPVRPLIGTSRHIATVSGTSTAPPTSAGRGASVSS
ncbi:MAG: biotin--[acetyl-CoA-carboxylase] ligase [Ilumatobacteraceae bacterium]